MCGKRPVYAYVWLLLLKLTIRTVTFKAWLRLAGLFKELRLWYVCMMVGSTALQECFAANISPVLVPWLLLTLVSSSFQFRHCAAQLL